MLGGTRWPAALLWSVALVQLAARAGARCHAGKPAYGCYDARNASRRALLHARVMPFEYIKSGSQRITLLWNRTMTQEACASACFRGNYEVMGLMTPNRSSSSNWCLCANRTGWIHTAHDDDDAATPPPPDDHMWWRPPASWVSNLTFCAPPPGSGATCASNSSEECGGATHAAIYPLVGCSSISPWPPTPSTYSCSYLTGNCVPGTGNMTDAECLSMCVVPAPTPPTPTPAPPTSEVGPILGGVGGMVALGALLLFFRGRGKKDDRDGHRAAMDEKLLGMGAVAVVTKDDSPEPIEKRTTGEWIRCPPFVPPRVTLHAASRASRASRAHPRNPACPPPAQTSASTPWAGGCTTSAPTT